MTTAAISHSTATAGSTHTSTRTSATVKPVNYWLDNKCAKAFWNQHELPAYQELLADTRAWMDPMPQESWLDVGCGCGQLSRALWEKSLGKLREVIGMDLATINEKAFAQLRAELQPAPTERNLRFIATDFQKGLISWPDNRFDGVVSGLAIQYADSYSPQLQQWTSAGYDGVLANIFRILRPGGRFVFSVNVPEPSWGTVAWKSMGATWNSVKPLRYLKGAYRMWRYGYWLKREARKGRFHFLPEKDILVKLRAAGFTVLNHRLSYANQAYIFRCLKSAV